MKKFFPGGSPSNHIVSQLNNNRKNETHSHSQSKNCPHCGSTNLSEGAGLKPGQISLKCSECKAFIGYRNLRRLKKLERRKQLTTCLELLETQGVSGDAAVFLLGQVGGKGWWADLPLSDATILAQFVKTVRWVRIIRAHGWLPQLWGIKYEFDPH